MAFSDLFESRIQAEKIILLSHTEEKLVRQAYEMAASSREFRNKRNSQHEQRAKDNKRLAAIVYECR